MSLPNCSNDHTAVLSSVDNTCQQQFRSAASFPAQKEVCDWRWGESRAAAGVPRPGGKVFPFSEVPSQAFPSSCPLCLFACSFSGFSRIFLH